MAGPSYHGRTHLPGGTDPIPGLQLPSVGGDTLDELLLAAAPDGFWKLNESSGTTAADSSGGGQDLSSVGWTTPAWGAAAGPPGEQTADMDEGTSGLGGTASRLARAWAALSGDFTAGIFFNRTAAEFTPIMGQGNPGRTGGSGWLLGVTMASGDENKPFLYTNDASGGPAFIVALNGVATDVWAMSTVTYDSSTGTFKLYVNGLLQGSSVLAYTPSSSDLWIGHDGGLGGNAVQISRVLASYGYLFPSVLTGDQILGFWEATEFTPADSEGYVLTLDAAGDQYWAPPTIEVTY